MLIFLFLSKLCLLASLYPVLSFAQQWRFSGRAEVNYTNHLATIVMVDPGPNWRGFPFGTAKHGVGMDLGTGVTFREWLYLGGGAGYRFFGNGGNSGDIERHGLIGYGEFELRATKHLIRPLFNLKLGHIHLWNQYPDGSGGFYTEFAGGVRHPRPNRTAWYLKAGLAFTNMSALFPLRVGYEF